MNFRGITQKIEKYATQNELNINDGVSNISKIVKNIENSVKSALSSQVLLGFGQGWKITETSSESELEGFDCNL